MIIVNKYIAVKKIFLIFLSAFILFSSLLVSSPKAENLKSKTKAVFIFKLFQTITWPEAKKINRNSELNFCSDSNYDFIPTLKYISEKKNMRFKVSAVSPQMDFSKCHILYIDRDQEQVLREFNLKEETGVLILGRRKDLYTTGGMISLHFKSEKLEIYINKSQLNKAGMKIQKRLLRFARDVR